MSDLELAMMEIEETKSAMSSFQISEKFRRELDRVKSDLNISPYVNLTDEMIKWVLVSNNRAQA